MQKLLRTSAWLMAVLLAVGMIGLVGCGDDDDDDAVVTATLDATAPAAGADIAANGTVTLTFSSAPEGVTVNGVAVTAGKTVTVNLADVGVTPGSQTLQIAWTGGDGGSATLQLNVTALDDTPPSLTGTDGVADGDENVEYDGLDTIKLMFDEPLNTTASRVIQIAPDGGDALPWNVSWEDDNMTAVITAATGGALTAETTYVVTATAPTDPAGNAADDVVITFTTRAKE